MWEKSTLSEATELKQVFLSVSRMLCMYHWKVIHKNKPPSYPESWFFLTSGCETSDPGKIRFEVRKYQTSGWIAYAQLSNERPTNSLSLLPVICIVFQTNQNLSCDGTFESCSFGQACTARNEDSKNEIEKQANVYTEKVMKSCLLTSMYCFVLHLS